jgi:hypothetical protein
LISERFVNLLKSNSIGGWSTFPVRITDKRGAQVPGYLGLSIVGHCGSVLQDALVKDDGGNMTRTKGFYLDPSLWDGSDIFMPDNYRVTLVVKTAREIIARGRLSNVAFEPATFLEALPSGR